MLAGATAICNAQRYIHTHLAKVARLLFPAEDDAILTYQEDDGLRVEPSWYLPVLPMVLVNGALGIGTGYSTSVPCYNPKDIIAVLKKMLDRDAMKGVKGAEDVEDIEDIEDIRPWYRGFKGTFEVINGRPCSRGVIVRQGGRCGIVGLQGLKVS